MRIWWQGPSMTILTPHKGAESTAPVVRVRGVVQNIARIYVNGLLIPISLHENTFVAEVALPEGYSTIGITGYSGSGTIVSENIPIVYNNKPLLSPNTQFLTPRDLEFIMNTPPTL